MGRKVVQERDSIQEAREWLREMGENDQERSLKVQQAKRQLKTGYYDRSEIVDKVADILVDELLD